MMNKHFLTKYSLKREDSERRRREDEGRVVQESKGNEKTEAVKRQVWETGIRGKERYEDERAGFGKKGRTGRLGDDN